MHIRLKKIKIIQSRYQFMPDIEPVFICQRKIKIVLKKYILKNAPTLAAENAQKFGGKILEYSKQFSRVMVPTGSHGIERNKSKVTNYKLVIMQFQAEMHANK